MSLVKYAAGAIIPGSTRDKTTGRVHLGSGKAVLDVLVDIASELESGIAKDPLHYFIQYGVTLPGNGSSWAMWERSERDLAASLDQRGLYYKSLDRPDSRVETSPFGFKMNLDGWTFCLDERIEQERLATVYANLGAYTFLPGKSIADVDRADSISTHNVTLTYWFDWRSHTWYASTIFDIIREQFLPESVFDKVQRKQETTKKRCAVLRDEAYAILEANQLNDSSKYVKIDHGSSDVSAYRGRLFLLERKMKSGPLEEILPNHQGWCAKLLMYRVLMASLDEPLAYAHLQFPETGGSPLIASSAVYLK